MYGVLLALAVAVPVTGASGLLLLVLGWDALSLAMAGVCMVCSACLGYLLASEAQEAATRILALAEGSGWLPEVPPPLQAVDPAGAAVACGLVPFSLAYVATVILEALGDLVEWATTCLEERGVKVGVDVRPPSPPLLVSGILLVGLPLVVSRVYRVVSALLSSLGSSQASATSST